MSLPRRILSSGVFVCAFLVAGCTLAPKTGVPATRPPTEWKSERTQGGISPGSGWRSVFIEPRLQALIALALERNLDLRRAILNVERSRAEYRIQSSDTFPAVTNGVSFARAESAGRTGNDWTLTHASASYVIDLFGRQRSTTEKALQSFLATDEARQATRLSIVATVASQYVALRQAEAELELSEETFAAASDRVELTRATVDAGAASDLDLVSARVQVETARANAAEFSRRAAQARHALAMLLGGELPVNLPSAEPIDAPGIVREVSAGLPSELLRRRPDIRRAEHSLLGANAGVGVARAGRFPSLSLTAAIGQSSRDTSTLMDAASRTWTVAPQLSLPLFDGGRARANVDAAKIDARIAVVDYEKTVTNAFREVGDALAAVESYEAQVSARRTLVAAQQRRQELADARYRQGEASYLEVLTAQQDLYNERRNLIDAQASRLSSLASLFEALGGEWAARP